RHRRLRAHARLARERPGNRTRAQLRPRDLRLRLRRGPRSRKAAGDGTDRGRAGRPPDRHLRQPAQRGSAGDHRGDRGGGGGRARGRAGPPSGDRPRDRERGARRRRRHRRQGPRAGAAVPRPHRAVRRPRGRAGGTAQGRSDGMIPLGLEEITALCPGALEKARWADEVTGVQIDSRRIEEGDLFVAVGTGADFVKHAFARGAAATLVPESPFVALAALGRVERVAQAKAEVIASLPAGGVAVVPDEPLLEPYLTRDDIEIRRFSSENVESFEQVEGGSRAVLALERGRLELEFPFTARHQ